MPWMSRLLGPPSETINSVSERASALAGDQIAGAGDSAPAANPDTDLRKSRRFMVMLQRPRNAGLGTGIARFVPNLNGTSIRPSRLDFACEYCGSRRRGGPPHPLTLHAK